MQNQKQAVARNSMIISGLLALGKFIAGIFTGSIGLISEGIHSFTDFIATSITWWAVSVSDKPADDDHHFGHGKVENLAALFEVLLLLAAGGWIIFEAVSSLIGEANQIVAAPVVITVLLVSIVVDFFRVRALNRVAKATNSAALEADALHFFSDMLSSGVVLLGMVFVLFGFARADALAALIVACFILVAALKLGKRSFDSLIDTAPVGTREDIATMLNDFPEVLSTENIRLRSGGATLFIEVSVGVCRTLPLERINALKQALTARFKQQYANSEVRVIALPQARSDEDLATRIRMLAANHGAVVQNLSLQQLADRVAIGMDLLVPANTSVEQAHDIASDVENDLLQTLGEKTEIETHLEPQMLDWLASQDVEQGELAKIEQALTVSAQNSGLGHDIHDIRARTTSQGMIVNFHCRALPALPIYAVHNAVDHIERQLRIQFPMVSRVVGHVEPLGSLTTP